jgi:adenylylsulfate kinase-like enzyme
VPELVVITGPIAAGKNTVAERLSDLLTESGRTVVVLDVDDVAAMVAMPGAAAAGLWFAAHEAHGALVGEWMRSSVDVVVVVGPIYSDEEQESFVRTLPDRTAIRWVVIDAPVSVTFDRACSDENRGLSRNREFHHAAHARFRELLPNIPDGLRFDSSELDAGTIADEIAAALRA